MRRLFIFVMVVCVAGLINYFIGAPFSSRGLDLTPSQIKLAYSVCALENGLPLKFGGYPSSEPVPIEDLGIQDRNIVLGCALQSGSYNFVHWALQNPPEKLSISSKHNGVWPIVAVARWENGSAAVDTLNLILEPNDALWSIGSSASLIAALYEARTVEVAEYFAEKKSYLLGEDNQSLFAPEDYPSYYGLTLAQYHAFKGRLDVAEYFSSKGSRVVIPGKNFRRWVMEHDERLLSDEKLNAFLVEHGVPRDYGQEVAATPDPNNPGETAISDPLLSKLPGLQGWRTFAKPLALGADSLLLFQRDGSNAVMWKIDWKREIVTSIPLPEIKLVKETRYTAVSSQDGLWLLGSPSVLILPNGEHLTRNTQFNEPVALVLNDQSVLVLGHSAAGSSALYGQANGEPFHLVQLRFNARANELSEMDRGILSYDGRPNQNGQNYRVPRYGHGAIKLRDGRVLMFGGDVTPTLASLIDPRNEDGPWTPVPVASLPNERVYGVAKALPDGRVIVTGAPSLRCYGEAAKVHSVDVYDVQNNRWSSLPPLPFVPCADAYGADTPSIALTPNNSLIVAAHLEPQVMVLPRVTNSPTGYADSWQVYGHMPHRRISGVVQPLSDQEVVVAGGVDRQNDGCCYATSGFDRINIEPSKQTESVAMGLIGAGVAKRGQQVFAGSGRRFVSTGFGHVRYSAHAELIDLSTGTVQQLPNIPFSSGAAQAFWLDENRILLKGIKESNSRGFDSNSDLASSMPPSSGAMAIYHIKDKRWSEPIPLRELDYAQLVAVDGNNVLLRSSSQLLRLDLNTRKLDPVQQVQRGRLGGYARLLSDGQLVLAGGEVQKNAVSAIDLECEVASGKKCPERLVGTGQYSPVALFELLSIRDRSPSVLSTMGPDDVTSTVITGQGRVIVLAQDSQGRQTSIALSKAIETAWENLPLPTDLGKDADHRCGGCALLVAADPRNPTNELLFLRQGAIDADYIDDAVDAQTVNVWWWSEEEQRWHHVLNSVEGGAARANPLALGEPLSPAQGNRMMSMGWHLREPVLWMEP